MKLLEKILLPVDFTECSDMAISAAVETATRFKSDIYLMHVIPDLAIDVIPMEMVEENVSKKLAEIRKQIEDAGATVSETILEKGSPIEKILMNASFYDVNVIISGSGSSSRHPLGATAGKLIRKSSKPVWIVKEGGSIEGKGILSPVDFSSASERALKNAVHLARHFGAELHVLTVVKKIDSIFSGVFTASEEKQKAYEKKTAEKFEAFLKKFDSTGVEVKKALVTGKPDEEIIRYIEQNGIGLTVLGSIGDSRDSYTMIGSVADVVSREMPSSLITFKNEDPISLKMEAELENIEYCTLQGNELLTNGMPDEALNHYKHCLTIDPLYARAWDNMAEAYRRKGDEKAAAEFKARSKEIEDRLWTQKVEAELRQKKFAK